MTLSLHLLADNADPARLDRAILYLRRVRPQYVNVGGGAQIDRAMQLAERIRAEVPGIKIVFRHMKPEDTGIHATMSPRMLYDLKIAPTREWFKKHEIIFMPDNETSGDDDQIKAFVRWQIEFAVLLHADNLRGAFARASTGNIGDGTNGTTNQYPLYKDLFTAMLPGDMISPNEYSNAPGKSSAGHLERYKRLWAVAGKPLETTIGEAGIAVNYDPGNGYRSIGLPGAKYAQEMIDQEIWYDNGKIDRFLYCIGGFGWESFQIGDDVLEHLEAYYANKQPPVIVQPPADPPPVVLPPFVPVPANLGDPHPVEIRSRVGYQLQAEPVTTAGAKVGLVTDGEQVTLYRSTQTSAGGLLWYFCERGSTPVGESNVGWIAYSLPPIATPQPEAPNLPLYGSPEWRQAVSVALRTLADLLCPEAA